METHVLSAKKLKKSLSAKAAAKKVVKSRNVLAWPKQVEYCPTLDTEANNDLKTLLESLLTPAKLPCCSLPLQVAKTVKGIERKEMRQKLYASKEDSCKMLRMKLLLGMNSVVRGIAGGKAVAVVVAGDNHQEQRLGKLVIDMCVQRKVPIVVVATLQEATRQCLGFGCLAIGVKKGASDGHFGPLVERVRELSSTSIQGLQGLPIKKEKETSNVSLEIPVKREVVSSVAQGGPTSVYKYRSSKKQRVFVLEDKSKGELASWLAKEAERESWPCVKPEPVERKPKIDFTSQDFISFGDDDESVKPAEVKKSMEAVRAGVKVEAKLKRKADYSTQDFISFGDSPASGSMEPKLKRKADAAIGQGDAIALVSPASMPTALEAVVTTETITSRPKLPKYRPLIVKSIQPNPTKKKKKKTEAAN